MINTTTKKNPCVENVVVGIDPGSIVCGYGILKSTGNKIIYIASGDVRMSKKDPLSVRLKHLYNGLIEVVKKYNPHEAAIEKVFYAKAITAALNLGHARGVAMLCASTFDIPVIEYTATEIKQSVTGYGRAEKVQVMEMIKKILCTNDKAFTKDSADALALAFCHIQKKNFQSYIKN